MIKTHLFVDKILHELILWSFAVIIHTVQHHLIALSCHTNSYRFWYAHLALHELHARNIHLPIKLGGFVCVVLIHQLIIQRSIYEDRRKLTG